MYSSSLLLSIDSFVAALALSTAVSHRCIAPVIALFGLCDGLWTSLGPVVEFQLPLVGLLSPAFLLLWAALMLLSLPVVENWTRSQSWAFLLPPLFAIDNMLLPGSEPDALAALFEQSDGGPRIAPGAIAWRTRNYGLPAGGRLA